jgi:hypothetical protein
VLSRVLTLSLEWIEDELDRIHGPLGDDLVWISVDEGDEVFMVGVSLDDHRYVPGPFLMGTAEELLPVLVALPTGIGVAGLRDGIRPTGSL